MEEGEYGLTRRTCFAARRLELVAVAGLLSISWCALGAARLHFFVSFVFFLRTHTACCRYEVPLPHLPLYQYRGAYRVPLMNLSVCLAVRLSVCLSVCLSFCLSVCLCMCNVRRFYWLRELYEADFHKPGIYRSRRVWANAWDVFRRTPSRGGRGRRVAVNYSVVCFFSVRWDFVFFSVRVLFFERTRPAACMRPPLALFTPLLVCTLRKHSIFTRLILGQVCMYSYDTCQICPDGVYLYVCSCVRHVSGVPVHVLLRISVVFTST